MGEAGVVIVNNLNNKIVTAVNAKSVMWQLASIETISSSALDFIIEMVSFILGWMEMMQEKLPVFKTKKKQFLSTNYMLSQRLPEIN